MFSGLVSYLQPVKKIEKNTGNILVTIKKPAGLKCKTGDSICINGVCSTVIKKNNNSFTVEYMPETLKRTTLANLKIKQLVNLETSLRLNDIVGGHLVSGHIDCTGEILEIHNDISSWVLKIKYPRKYSKYIVEKGSIAIDGISLTCFDVKSTSFLVSLIPHTIQNTNIQNIKKSSKLNLEFDLIGKYVEKITRV